MIPGDAESTGQVKNAYEIARASGLTGSVLNRVFQKAFQATKEIRAGVDHGGISIPRAVVEVLQRTFGNDLTQRSVINIGADEMAERCPKS
jgi:glutamyl-tRNA reductase